MDLMLKGSSGESSTSKSVFWYGSLICLFKLLTSKVTLWGFIIPEFSGSEFAVALTALGGIRALDKHIVNRKEG